MRSLIQLIPYEPKFREAWGRVVEHSRNGTFLHHRGYIDYHADRFLDKSALFVRNNQVVAALPGTLKDDVLSSHAGLTYGGLIMPQKLHADEVIQILELIVDWGRSAGISRLMYKSVPHIYHRAPAEDDLYAISRMGGQLVRRDLSTSLSIDEVSARMSKGRRARVSKAARNGVRVQEGSDYPAFMRIATAELTAKYGLQPTHSAAELSLLASRFPENIKLLLGYLDGRILGGVVLYVTHTVCHVQYIASTDEGRMCGVVDLCIYEALSRYVGKKRWFDFGISTTGEGREVNFGLLMNKETWAVDQLFTIITE